MLLKKYFYVVMLIVILYPLDIISAEEDWGYIVEELNKGLQIERLDHYSDRDVLLAHTMMFRMQIMSEPIKEYISHDSDEILLSIFIAYHLLSNKNLDNLFPFLNLYIDRNQKSSVPKYFLSYYYLKEGDLQSSLRYLKEGNIKGNFNTYESEMKKILYDYLMSQTSNMLISYSHTISCVDTNLLLLMRKLSGDMLKEEDCNEECAEEMVKLGVNIENHSMSVYEKLIGIGIQIDGYKNINHTTVLNELEKKHAQTMALSSKLSGKTGEKALLDYLISAYKYGELYSLEKLSK